MQELVRRVQENSPQPWNKRTGRPKSCGLYRAVEIACMYIRQNATQEFLGDMRGVSQSTVSRIITVLVPIVKAVLAEFVPSLEDAFDMVSGRLCLVDGTITPCWSYADHKELWSRKHGTTGFNTQIVCLLDAIPVYISSPLAGKNHDMAAYEETQVVGIVKRSAGGFGDKGYQGSDLITPRKKTKYWVSARGTKRTTRSSPDFERLSKESSHTSNHGEYSTPTIDVDTVPIVTRLTLAEDFSSSRSPGVLNNLPDSQGRE